MPSRPKQPRSVMHTVLPKGRHVQAKDRARPRRSLPAWARAGLAALPVILATLCAVGQQEPRSPRTWLGETIEKAFPDACRRKREGFGWEQYQRGEWRNTPEHLPTACVLLIHGLDEPGKLWIDAAPAIADAGYNVLRLTYPNDQPIRDSAAFLMLSLQDLRDRGVRQVALVSHSMGGLVCREMLTSPTLNCHAAAEQELLPTIQGLIMLGTPNHGAPLAKLRIFAELREQWTRFVRGEGQLVGAFADGCGEAGDDLHPDSTFLRDLNARSMPESLPVTIVAGVVSPLSEDGLRSSFEQWRRTAPDGVSQSLERLHDDLRNVMNGVGDGVVPLESTRLQGVDDHQTVQGNHVSMIRNPLPNSDQIPPAIPIILQRLNQWKFGKADAGPH